MSQGRSPQAMGLVGQDLQRRPGETVQPGFCRAGLHRGQRMSTGQAQWAGNPRPLPLPAITTVGQGLGDTGTGSSQGWEGQPTEPETMAEWLVRAGGQNCSTTYSGDRGIPNTALTSIWRRAQTCLPANLQPGVATWLSLLSSVTTAVCHLLVMPSEGTGMCAPVPSHQRGCRRDVEQRHPQGPRRVLC